MHFSYYGWGSLPPAVGSPEDGAKFWHDLVPNSRNRGTGEVRKGQRNWIATDCKRLADLLDIRGVARFPGDHHYYDYPVRRAMGWLDASRIATMIDQDKERVSLGEESRFALSYPKWALEDAIILDRLKLDADVWRTVSTGAPTEWCFFTGVPMEHVPFFGDLMVAANCKILAERPDAVLQMDFPKIFVGGLVHPTYEGMLAYYIKALRPAVKVLDDTAKQYPGVRVVAHPCLGDLNGPLAPRSAHAVLANVAFNNAMSYHARGKKWVLVGTGMTCCDGRRPPKFSPKIVEAMALLDPLPEGCALMWGAGHPDATPQETEEFVRKVAPVAAEHAQVDQFYLTLPCGAGRYDLDTAKRGISNSAEAADLLNAA